MSDETIARLHDDGLAPRDAARLDAGLAQLPLDIDPPEALFARVEEALPVHRAGGAWGGFAVAASLAAVALVVTLTLVREDEAPAPEVADATPAPASAALSAAAAEEDRYRTASLPRQLGGRAAFGDGFLKVRQQMSNDFATRLDSLDPTTRRVVETNLKVIHGALGRIENALADDPGNTVLQDLLMSTYRQELDYMGQIRLMPAGPSGRAESEGSMEL